MRYKEESVHIRDLRLGDYIPALSASVIGKELIPAANPHAMSNVHYQLGDGRILLLRERMAVRCRQGDVKKILSSVAVPEYIAIRRESPKGTLTAESGFNAPSRFDSNGIKDQSERKSYR